jgi:hypothetical protein
VSPTCKYFLWLGLYALSAIFFSEICIFLLFQKQYLETWMAPYFLIPVHLGLFLFVHLTFLVLDSIYCLHIV